MLSKIKNRREATKKGLFKLTAFIIARILKSNYRISFLEIEFV